MKKIILLISFVHLSISHAFIKPLTNLDNWNSQGNIAFEGRQFKSDNNKTTEDSSLALQASLETNFKANSFSYKLTTLTRIDEFDTERNLIEFPENFFSLDQEWWQVVIGHQIFNWSILEAFHPANIMNSKNYDGDVENPEKLGELSANLEFIFDNCSLSFYYLPYYKNPHYPGEHSRMSLKISPSPSISNQLGKAYWVEGNNKISGDSWGNQGAVRFNYIFSDLEIALHIVHHMDRSQPQFSLADDYMIHPYFFKVTQYGGSVQYVLDKWIFKLEHARRDFNYTTIQTMVDGPILKPIDHNQTAIGLEGTFALSWGHDLIGLWEYQRLWDISKSIRASYGLFQNDMMIGFRYAFNDQMGREIIFTSFADLERKHEYLINTSYSQRLSDTWKMNLGFRYIDAPKKDSTPKGMEYYHGNHFIFGKLTRFF